MSLKNASVALTYNIRGAQLASGKYEYRERTTQGKVIEGEQRLFTIKKPEISKCYISMTLGEHFVNHAISDEGRPKREDGFKAYVFWRKMSETERLHFHIHKFVHDMGAEIYEYSILES
jgi:hypothetical protein